MNKRLVTSLLLAIMLAGLWLFVVQKSATAVSNGTLCVNTTGADGCYTSIQTAIDEADPNDRINVDSGTYYEHIILTKDLELVGKGWENSIIDGQYSSPQTVVKIESGISANTIISGFKIIGGGTGISATSTQFGGGLGIFNASPKIVNTWVYSCTAHDGGGVYINGSSPYFENVPAWNNQAYQRGGGFYITGGAEEDEITIVGNLFELTNGTILWNTAGWDGGGFYIWNVTTTLRGLKIYWNTADSFLGGGIHVSNDPNPVLIQFNDISGNTADYGGGIFTYDCGSLDINGNNISYNNASSPAGLGGGIMFDYSSLGIFSFNLVHHNETIRPGGGGGGIYLRSPNTNMIIFANRIDSNVAGFGGGILVAHQATPKINANSILTNTANVGGGIAILNTGVFSVTNNIIARNVVTGAGVGGGISINTAAPRIVNNTIVDNTGDGVIFYAPTGLQLYNNIIAWNSNDGIELDNIPPTTTIIYQMDYNDVYNNFGWNYKNIPSNGPHDMSIDPEFIGAGDAFEYYHLQLHSPVLSTGAGQFAPLRDIDGDIRLLNGMVSMGADEIEFPVFLPIILRNFP
jgi:hypothetical protein